MERYEAYKDSGVKWLGEIPVTWTCGRIRSVYALRKELVEDGEPDELVSVSEYYGVDYRRNRISSSDVLVRADSLEGYQLCYPDDLVMNIMLAWKGAQGTSAIKGLVSPSYGVFRPLEGSCPRYYHYLMRTDQYKEYFKSYSSGIIDSRLRLYPEVFLHLNCHVPPLEEQQAIADYLDAKTTEIDALVVDCEREVGLLQEYRKAVISEVVTKGLDPDAPMKDSGVEWIGEIPETWLAAPLKHIVVSIESGTSLDGASWPASENEKGVLTLSAVYQSRFDANQNKAISTELYGRLSCPLKSGTLLISRCNTSEWVGTAAYVTDAPDNLFLPDKLWQLTFDSDFVCRFIQYALQANAARNYFAALSVGASSTMQNIAKSDLLATPIAIPNGNGVAEIVAYLDTKTAEIDALIDAKQTMADKLREYRRSLISEAVTGKFKVPGV